MKYIISDIHGVKSMFKEIINEINLTENDNLYILGDVIDRGDDGIDILKWCYYHHLKHGNVHLILGDHECMMLNALGHPIDRNDPSLENPEELMSLWFMNGGRVTYEVWNQLSAKDQGILISYLRSCSFGETLEIAGKKYYLGHACHPEIARRFVNGKNLVLYNSIWSRFLSAFNSVLRAGEIVIFGHTMTDKISSATKDSIIRAGNLIAIDCGCAAAACGRSYGRLGCLCIDDEGNMSSIYSNRL